MAKQSKPGKTKATAPHELGERDARSGAALTLARPADPLLLDPYDWGPEGVPEGQPLRYVPGQGFVLEG